MSGSTWLEDNAQQVPLTTTTPDSTDPTGTTDSNKNGNQSDLYKSVSMDNQEIHNGDLILVNNSTAYESTDENELEAVYEKKTDSYSVSGSELMLRGDVIENLNNMLDDFQTETGHDDIIIISGYRTTEQQQELYDADLEDTGEDTSTLVAKPGYSEHETGYAMDFSLFEDGISADYDGTGEYDWINQNCAHYGFILRYPENKTDLTEIRYESWHYRYVGQPHAYYMQQNDLCLEEYTETLKDYSVDNPLEITNWDGKVYQIYYVPAEAGDSTYVMVPPDQEYTVSGNNVDGFIITVDTGVTNLDEAETKTTTTTATSDGEDTETTETETETDALAESDWNTEDWEY
jgi:peptidase M15B and M15C DD-carboxypeptidase vanY/endolysin